MLYMPIGTPAYEKVMARAVKAGDCLVFTGAKVGKGYGYTRGADSRMEYAHRAVMERHHGTSDLCVIHSCDNPACVNIEHLRYGTHTENMADMKAKKRGRKSRFSDAEIAAIRSDPRTQTAIASDYGCSRSLVSMIKSGGVSSYTRS